MTLLKEKTMKQNTDFVATTVKNFVMIPCQCENAKGNQNLGSNGASVALIIVIFPGCMYMTNGVIS